MKKIFVLIFTMIGLSRLAAQNFLNLPGDFHLSITPILAMTNGQLGEYVYTKISDSEDKKISELQWDEKLIVSLGGAIRGGYKNIFLDISFARGFSPSDSGKMEDSDWMNSSDPTMKTTFSINENTLVSYTTFNTKAGYTFRPLPWLYLSPYAEFEYLYRLYSGNNGYGWYGQRYNVPWTDPKAIYYKPGELCGIDYSRMMISSYIGGTVQFNLPANFSIQLSAAISPASYQESYDTHFTTTTKTSSKNYLDIASNDDDSTRAFFWGCTKFSATLCYNFSPNFDVSFTYSARLSWLQKGVTATQNSQGVYVIDKQSLSGFDMYESIFKLSCTFHLKRYPQ